MSNLKNYKIIDGSIKDIRILTNTVEIKFNQWNEKIITIVFEEYWRLKDNNSVDIDVSEISEVTNSLLIDEVKQDIIDGDGSEQEAEDLIHFTFIGSWGDKVLLEIVARNVKVVE